MVATAKNNLTWVKMLKYRRLLLILILILHLGVILIVETSGICLEFGRQIDQ